MGLSLQKEFALVQQQAELDSCTDKAQLIEYAIDLARAAGAREAGLGAKSKDEAVASILGHYSAESTVDYWQVSLSTLPIDQLRSECKRVLRLAHEAEARLAEYFKAP
jgi:glutamate/tyrosine decarboxylase-like PLP-dependent enzyme